MAPLELERIFFDAGLVAIIGLVAFFAKRTLEALQKGIDNLEKKQNELSDKFGDEMKTLSSSMHSQSTQLALMTRDVARLMSDMEKVQKDTNELWARHRTLLELQRPMAREAQP